MSNAKVIQIQATREQIPFLYLEVLEQNPLLARIEGTCRTICYSDLEIRTLQLLAACRSNASLTQRLQELEGRLAEQVEGPCAKS